MNYLLDTRILMAFLEGRPGAYGASIERLLDAPTSRLSASAASLWEIAIKTRLGKLRASFDIATLPGLLDELAIRILPINEHHALALVEPEPDTKDPFDRTLLAQCQVEDLRLITADRSLVGHRLAAEQI